MTYLIFSFLTGLNIFASDLVPVIQHEQTSDEAFTTQLYLHTSWQAYSEYQLEHIQNEELSDKLIQLLSSARKAELQKDLDSAKIYYLKIMDLFYQADWSEGERKVFHHAKRFLKQIPKKTKKVTPPPQWEGFRYALVNGQSFHVAKDDLIIPEGKIRLTLVSDKYQAVTHILDAKQIALMTPKKVVLATGNCETGISKSNTLPKAIAMVLPKCILDTQSDKKMAHRKQPGEAHQMLESRYEIPKKRNNFLKSPWFWAGASLVAGYFIYENNKDKKSSPPPSREGF